MYRPPDAISRTQIGERPTRLGFAPTGRSRFGGGNATLRAARIVLLSFHRDPMGLRLNDLDGGRTRTLPENVRERAVLSL